MTQSSSSNQPGQATPGAARPRELTPLEQAAISKPSAAVAAPSSGQARPPANIVVTPPPAPGQAAPSLMPGGVAPGGPAGTAWLNNIQISALWSINQDRNVWVYVSNTGWVKLSTASESGVVALTILASYAKQAQDSISCRQESDGMIHEIYAW